MTPSADFELVIGLEVHAQLLTQSKLFCGDSIAYGAAPNTQVSPITLGHPGTLPKMNRQAVEYAVKMGIACHCEIERSNFFARKNYFYPDLPKGYQVSQHTTPICKGGYITIKTEAGTRNIRLNRIHLEEDAGKSIHDRDEYNTCIDYNRAGTPLIEIVSEPDLHSAEEVFAYLTGLRKMVRYLGVCDGNMEEGSLRCDVNISVRRRGEEKLGTKVEIKNLNSIRNAKRAVEVEAGRLTELVAAGEKVIQQTRGYDADKNITYATREKEDADDYRYFADPDLTPFALQEDFIAGIRNQLPALQQERIERYTGHWSLPAYDAEVITEERDFADYFEKIAGTLEAGGNIALVKSAANWMLGPVRTWMNETKKEIGDFPVSAEKIAGIVQLVDGGQLSFSAASGRLFAHLLKHPQQDALAAAGELNLVQESDAASLEPLIESVLAKYADKVKEYKKGKKGVLSLFVGEVMKQSKGKADPKVTNALLLKKLKS